MMVKHKYDTANVHEWVMNVVDLCHKFGLNFAMVERSASQAAPARFCTASGGAATAVTPRFSCGEDASGADSTRRRQQAIQRKEAVGRHSCTTQVERGPDQQHQIPPGVCGAVEQSQRRSGERKPRRLERRSRGAHRAKRCELPEEVQVGQQKVRAAKPALLRRCQAGRR